ncbi:MAG: hypothetical protein J6J04_05675 [Oscillospiraceae bacterium]|nr:hypothetical protein [Oscillospiraceae bacterium]
MALEFYAGTLTRYYSDVDSPEEAAKVSDIVTHWRDTVIGAVKSAAPEAAAWEENADKEYLAVELDKLHLGALLSVAASAAYGRKPRETVYPDWDCEAEAAVQSAHADPNMPWSLMKGASWWLPVQTPVMLKGEVPTGEVVTIASCGALMMELLRINELVWRADEAEVLRWAATEGKMEAGAKRFSTDSLAKYAYSMLWQLAKFSLQMNVPIVMDEV